MRRSSTRSSKRLTEKEVTVLKRSKFGRWATKPRVAVLLVLAVASFGLSLYALAANPPAPTISSGPANPTSSTSASFTYTDSKNITRFECSLDGSAFQPCGTARPSTTTYSGPLSQTSHIFQVRAVSGSETSATTAYSWMVDATPPQVSSINRSGSNPTNASSVSWAVAFSEPVTGVDATDFTLVRWGLAGSSAIISVSGFGSSYTMTATAGTGTGSIRLDVVDNDSIRDGAGNRLGGTGNGNGNFTGQPYLVDTVPPSAPHLTQMPPDPAPSGDTTFAWTEPGPETNVSFQCAKENGAWSGCTSPYSYTVTTTNNSQHQFTLRAIDQAGNVSSSTTYVWKVSQVSFIMAGSVSGLYLGAWRSIAVTVTNPNNFKIYVNAVSVGVSLSPTGCPASTNIEFVQSPISASHTLMVPANSTVALSALDRPQIRLVDLPYTNQDACKGKTFKLAYAGTATN